MSHPCPLRAARSALPLLAGLAVLLAATSGSALEPRRPLRSEPIVTHPGLEVRLVVKFVDAARIRADASGRPVSAAGREVAPIEAVALAHDVTFRPLLPLPEVTLGALEARAADRSGREQPDLAGMLAIEAGTTDATRLAPIAEAFDALPDVEWTSLEQLLPPPPVDIPPTTPDFSASQTYRFDNPGANSDWAAGLGVTGQGVRLSDCEYGWNDDHEDLEDIDLHLEPGQTVHPNVEAWDYDEHGTSVLGEIAAVPNAYGCTGMAPDAEIHTFPEYTVEGGFRRTACITAAIAGSGPGDVVLLEMQTTGAGGGYGPAELDLSVWTVVRAGVDAGIVVVGAAGNGDQDLDSAPYVPYMSRGDSGAILVGAGSASIFHNKLGFSTYGSRVNVQAWGEAVDTMGYGDIAVNGSDERQFYTVGFSGTSSASPIAASAAVLLQSWALATLGQPLDPDTVRQWLIDTGWPQGTGGWIGPAVNIKKALNQMIASVDVPGSGPVREGLLRVLGAFPDPFPSATTLRFSLGAPAAVDLTLHDVAGRRVRTLAPRRDLAAGLHAIRWDGRDDDGRLLPGGVYFWRLTAGGENRAGRVTLRR